MKHQPGLVAKAAGVSNIEVEPKSRYIGLYNFTLKITLVLITSANIKITRNAERSNYHPNNMHLL